MKKVIFGLIAVAFVSLSSFTDASSSKVFDHNCTYRMYSANGTYLGTLTTSYPNYVACSSLIGRYYAVEIWNSGRR